VLQRNANRATFDFVARGRRARYANTSPVWPLGGGGYDMWPKYDFPGEWPEPGLTHLYYVWFDLVDWFLQPPGKRRTAHSGQAWPLFNWRMNIQECIAVAKKRVSGNETPVTLKKFDPDRKMQWTNVKLGTEDVALVMQRVAHPPEVATDFLGLAAEGHEISLKQAADGGWMACMFGDAADGSRRGLSAFAKDPITAGAALVQKWYGCLDGSWPEGETLGDFADIR